MEGTGFGHRHPHPRHRRRRSARSSRADRSRRFAFGGLPGEVRLHPESGVTGFRDESIRRRLRLDMVSAQRNPMCEHVRRTRPHTVHVLRRRQVVPVDAGVRRHVVQLLRNRPIQVERRVPPPPTHPESHCSPDWKHDGGDQSIRLRQRHVPVRREVHARRRIEVNGYVTRRDDESASRSDHRFPVTDRDLRATVKQLSKSGLVGGTE